MEITMLSGYDLNGGECKTQKPTVQLIRQYVDTACIEKAGLVPTEKFLKENKIPYASVVNPENNAGSFSVATPNGILNVPPVITQAQAASLLKQYKAPVSTPEESQSSCESKSKFPWWVWLALGAAGIIILGSDSEPKEKKEKGLSGPPKPKSVAKSKKAKINTIHV